MKNWLKILAFTAISANMYAQQSFTIDDAWKYAVENNVNVQKAKIDQTIADQKVKETVGIGLPQVNAKGTYNYFLKLPVQLLPAQIFGGPEGTYIPVTFGTTQTASGGITLSQLLFNGSYIVGLESSRAYRETAALAEQKTEISIKQAILLSYTAVIVTDENLKTLEENRKVVSKYLNDMEQTYKVGLIELQSVEQFQYNYKSLVTVQENLKRTRQQFASTLKYLMGLPADKEMSLTSTLDELIQKNETLTDTGKNNDVSNHIDYKIRKNLLRISELQLKYQKSKALPSLAGFLSSTYNGNSNTFSFFKKEQQWFNTSVAGLQLDIPIFSGLQRHWQTQQATLNMKKAKLDLEDTEKYLQNKVSVTSLDYESAYNSYKNAKELVELSSSIYKKQQIKFKEGMGTSFELSQAESQLYDAQTKYYQAALNLIQAKTKLDEALGKL